MIKRLITALAFVSASAFATGPHDGVYTFTSVASSSLISVHQSGNTLLLVTLSQRPNVLNGSFSLAPSYTVTPAVASIWEYAIGPLIGQEATVNNPSAFYGACSVNLKVKFDGVGGMTLTPTSGTTTDFGRASGVACGTALTASLGSPGTVFSLAKAF